MEEVGDGGRGWLAGVSEFNSIFLVLSNTHIKRDLGESSILVSPFADVV